MASRLVLLLLLMCISRPGLGQTSSTVAPVPSTTSSSTPAPTPGPTPPPHGDTNVTVPSVFILMDDNNTNLTCLRLDAHFTFIFNYNITLNETTNVTVPFVDNSVSNANHLEIDYEQSMCNVTTPLAKLTIKFTPDVNQPPYYLHLAFMGSRKPGNQAWQFKDMAINFTYHADMFPNYHGKQPADNSEHYLVTNTSLFDDTNQRVEFTRQYICIANQTFKGFTSPAVDNSFNFFLNVSNLEVQAFNLSDKGNQTFSPRKSARQCLADMGLQSNVVVPIAVGAALAVLVTLVIIAYLVARIRNRKRGSYEALSS